MKKKFFLYKKIIVISFVVIIFLLLIFSVIFSLININNQNILNGIWVNRINISGMTKEEANSILLENIDTKEKNNINIKISDDIQTTINFESLDINYNISSCVNEAYNIGRIGNIFENNFDIFNLLLNKKNINLKIELNDEKLNNLISDLSSNLPNKVIRKQLLY